MRLKYDSLDRWYEHTPYQLMEYWWTGDEWYLACVWELGDFFAEYDPASAHGQFERGVRMAYNLGLEMDRCE